MKNKFSIIIPTYTGEEHIEKCFTSILEQKDVDLSDSFEVIVVIDGPNKSLEKKVVAAKKLFATKKVNFTKYVFSENQGRFKARIKGSEIAKYEQLLFVDDRVVLDTNFVNILKQQKEKLIMPNVLESNHPNSISRLNFLIRSKVYGKDKWGEDFKSQYIDKNNFEKSSKGTTSLWIPKKDFTIVCEKVLKEVDSKSTKTTNDDTRILKMIVEKNRILRNSELKIYYNPRSKYSEELAHLYHRGPTFVDYYLKPGTRFRPLIIAGIIVLLVLVALILFSGLKTAAFILIVLLIVDIFLSLYISKTIKDFLMALVQIPAVAVAFGAGIVKGLFIKIT